MGISRGYGSGTGSRYVAKTRKNLGFPKHARRGAGDVPLLPLSRARSLDLLPILPPSLSLSPTLSRIHPLAAGIFIEGSSLPSLPPPPCPLRLTPPPTGPPPI